MNACLWSELYLCLLERETEAKRQKLHHLTGDAPVADRSLRKLLLLAEGFFHLLVVALDFTQLLSVLNILLILCFGDGGNLHTVRQLSKSGSNYAVADLKTRGHDVVLTVVLGIYFDLGILYLVVLAYSVDEDLVLYFCRRILRDNNGIGSVTRNDDRACTTALEQMVGVSKVGSDAY